jgi:hypothetical protein
VVSWFPPDAQTPYEHCNTLCQVCHNVQICSSQIHIPFVTFRTMVIVVMVAMVFVMIVTMVMLIMVVVMVVVVVVPITGL